MKIKLTILKLAALLGGILAPTAGFGATQIWGGEGDHTNADVNGNWQSGAYPTPAGNDTAQWSGVTTSDLFLINNTANWASGPGSSGLIVYLTGSQTNAVTIQSTLAVSQGMAVDNITMDPGAGALTLGSTSSARLFYMPQRPSGATHIYLNNSTNPATINPWVRYISGGGAAYILDFGGSGNWIVNNYLQPDNGGGAVSVQVDGPGAMIWTPQGYSGSDAIGTINITGGTLELAGPHAKLNSRPFTDNGIFQFNALAQAQALSGVISGGGVVQVSNGTLTLSGANTYTGNTLLSGGELFVNSAENLGTSGPLGVGGTISFAGGILGFTLNNKYDYSPRFSTAAGQEFIFDNAGYNVTLTNAVASVGGTLTSVGSGTLTLAGANTYNGLTTVSAGTLEIQGSAGAGPITVANSATLGVTETGPQINPSTLTVGTSASAALQFNNVASTTTPPIAAGVVSEPAGSPVNINVTGGSFIIGQHYPLLSWSSGSAPGVSLQSLVGAVGNLSTNGNTIQLNVTSLAFIWSGLNNTDWDTNTPNNWKVNGISQIFANGGSAVFDDTVATANTNVVLNSPVAPGSVTVSSSSKPYTITSSGINLIGGSGGLTKNGTTILTLAGGINTYTGATTINAGMVTVGTLAGSGIASDIGAANSSAASLVLNGGTLQYTGGGAAIDHLFTLGTAGGTIDNEGGTLALTNAGVIALSGAAAHGLTLTGSDTSGDTLAASLADYGAGNLTSLTKDAGGTWILTGTNTYSGGTVINGGTLQIGAGGATGSPGTGTITDNGILDFNVTNVLTVAAVNGSGSLINDGTGTVILAANNGYQGGTTINAGTVQFGTGGATGTIYGNAPIVDNGTVIFDTTSPISQAGFNNNLGGVGNVIVRAGFVKTGNGNNVTYSGWTEIDPGAVFQPCTGQTTSMDTSVITNNGMLKLVSQNVPATFSIPANIVGTGRVWMDTANQNAGYAVLAGMANTYSGGTFLGGGGIVLGDGVTPGSGTIVGSVVFTNTTGPTPATFNTSKRILFNRADNITFSNNIISAVSDGSTPANSGSLEQMGPGTVALTGNNSYPGDTTIDSGAVLQVGNGGAVGSIGAGPTAVTDNGELDFNLSANVVYTNAINGAGSFVQLGSGTTTLTGALTYGGSTTVSNGVLVIDGSIAGDLDVDGGVFAPGASGTVTNLNVGGSLNINGGVILATLNKSLSPSNSTITVSGGINGSGGTLNLIHAGPALAVGDTFTLFNQPLNGTVPAIVSPGFTVTNNLAVDGSVTVTSVVPATNPKITATFSGGVLNLSWPAGSGLHLQAQTNSLAAGLSNNWVNTTGGTDSSYTIAPNPARGAVFYRLSQ